MIATVFVPAGVRVISNAGATNPLVCAATLDKMTRKAGVHLNIAVVTGDDIMGEVIGL